MVKGRFSYFGLGSSDSVQQHLTETEWEALKATGKVTKSPVFSKPSD
jgi:hypothetical protein